MQTIEMEHFTMELLESKENANRDKIILQLHGGGYVGAMRNAYRMFAGLYNEVSHGMSVLTPDYRVAPEHPYPAALEDAVCAYEWLLAQGWFSEQIIVAGDSAGGGLAMALCHYLSNHGRQLPCGIIAMSPLDGSDGKRGVLRYQLREGSPVWKDQGQPDLQSGLCGRPRPDG